MLWSGHPPQTNKHHTLNSPPNSKNGEAKKQAKLKKQRSQNRRSRPPRVLPLRPLRYHNPSTAPRTAKTAKPKNSEAKNPPPSPAQHSSCFACLASSLCNPCDTKTPAQPPKQQKRRSQKTAKPETLHQPQHSTHPALRALRPPFATLAIPYPSTAPRTAKNSEAKNAKQKTAQLTPLLKRLDKYLIGNYLKSFGFTVLIFTLVATIINFSEMVQRFLDNEIPWSEVLNEYYLWYIPYINSQLIPLYALIAVIFFTSRLAGNSEILSMLNAGMSLSRIARPYMIAAAIIAGFALLLNHVIVPYGNAQRLAFEREKLGREKDLGNHSEVHMFIAPGSKVYVRHYSKTDSIARDIRLENYDGPRLVSMLSASRAQWNGQDSSWRFFNHSYRTFDGLNESFVEARTAPLDTLLPLFPSDFIRYKYEKDQLSTAGLMAYIDKQRARGVGNTSSFEIERDKRTAEPFSVFILTLIGLAIAGRKSRGGMGINLVSGIVLGLVFVFLSRFSHTLANSAAIPTVVGVWIPNAVFALVAAFLLSRAQR